MAFRDKFRIRARIREVLKVKDSPHRIAISFAFGVFWGMSPLLGLHTIGAFFSAWLLRLNRFVAVVGVYITNPWTIVPIYSFSLWIGAQLIGMEQILPDLDWKNITFTDMMTELSHLILPFCIGTVVVGTVSAVVSYFIIHSSVVKYRKVKNGA
jgi:uncharacterized protein (DUF2062 family)